jgi:glycosyltransferase involved in cell wall biosynthesis
MHFTANTGWSRSGSPPFVLTVHDMLFMDTPVTGRSLRQVVGHRYVRRSVLAALPAADLTATPSAASAADIVARAGVPAPAVIPNGVDFPSGRGDDSRRQGSSYAVAFSARDPRKGIELAVAGWRAAETPDQLWLLAGAGMPEGLEREIAPEVRDGRIVVIPYVPRPRLHEILKGAAALIYPSHAEGFGLPVVEAMAAGVPVITGLASATREVGGEAIMPIDRGQPAASIARGLRLIARDPDTVARLVAAGRRRAEMYSWSACAGAYLELYEAAAARAGRPGRHL